jgi:hypothetical protein
MSLQLQPELAAVGERCPFGTCPFPLDVIDGPLVVEDETVAFAGVRVGTFRALMGLLLFDLALLNSALESSSSSMPSSMGV